MIFVAIIVVLGVVLGVFFAREAVRNKDDKLIFAINGVVAVAFAVAVCIGVSWCFKSVNTYQDAIRIYADETALEEVLAGYSFNHDELQEALDIINDFYGSENGVDWQDYIECGEIGYGEFNCQHKATYTEVVTLPTCSEAGIKRTFCRDCGKVLMINEIPATGHNYAEWQYNNNVTSEQNRGMYRTCAECGETEAKSYDSVFGENYIYIEGTGVCGEVVPKGVSQADIDACDMAYGDYLLNCYGPWVLGHSSRTFCHLPETKIGAKVLLSVNGNVRVYEVFTSEYAVLNQSKTDIIGQETGYSILSSFDDEVLRMSTCYGDDYGRWMVLARLVED